MEAWASLMTGAARKMRTTLEMIKWEHSVFALPFALTAALLAANGLPAWRVLGWILVAMVAARSAAMAFNRWADAELDAANPRTQGRAIPAGLLTRGFVLGFACVAALVFLLAAGELNRLTLELAPVVLAMLLGYSYLKRLRAGRTWDWGWRWGWRRRGVDCGAGRTRPADSGADGGGDAVGGGVRRALRLPGLRA